MQSTPVIIQFDSERYYVQVTDLILYPAGLGVTAFGLGKQQAIELLEKVKKGTLVPTIAIIDTLLQFNHTEGEKVAAKLKELQPDVKIIAYTIINDEPLAWADYTAIKTLKDTDRTLRQALQATLNIELDGNNQVDKS